MRSFIFEFEFEFLNNFSWKHDLIGKNGKNGKNGQSRLYPVFLKSSTWAKRIFYPGIFLKSSSQGGFVIILLQIFFGSVVGTPELILSRVIYFIFSGISSGIELNTRRRQL